MRIIINCNECKRNIKLYFKDSPYSETCSWQSNRYSIFDYESSIGIHVKDSAPKELQTAHIFPCPYCEKINKIEFELIKHDLV